MNWTLIIFHSLHFLYFDKLHTTVIFSSSQKVNHEKVLWPTYCVLVLLLLLLFFFFFFFSVFGHASCTSHKTKSRSVSTRFKTTMHFPTNSKELFSLSWGVKAKWLRKAKSGSEVSLVFPHLQYLWLQHCQSFYMADPLVGFTFYLFSFTILMTPTINCFKLYFFVLHCLYIEQLKVPHSKERKTIWTCKSSSRQKCWYYNVLSMPNVNFWLFLYVLFQGGTCHSYQMKAIKSVPRLCRAPPWSRPAPCVQCNFTTTLDTTVCSACLCSSKKERNTLQQTTNVLNVHLFSLLRFFWGYIVSGRGAQSWSQEHNIIEANWRHSQQVATRSGNTW